MQQNTGQSQVLFIPGITTFEKLAQTHWINSSYSTVDCEAEKQGHFMVLQALIGVSEWEAKCDAAVQSQL